MIEPGDNVQGRYSVIRELSTNKGAFGKIFEVEDKYSSESNKQVLKVLKVLKLSDFSNQDHKEKLKALFERAASVLRRIHHSGIPTVEQDGYFRDRCPRTQEVLHCLVMEKIEGEDLGEYIKNPQNQAISQQQALNWLKQLLGILKEIHPDFVHRDIKPDNIMLKPDNKLVLIDFGAVKALGETYLAIQGDNSRTAHPTAIGTPGYIPPEQQLGQPVELQSDFFALGRTFVHLLTKQHPFDFELNTKHQIIWREQSLQVSERFADLIDWMMEYDLRKRPKNADEILRELEAISKPQDTSDNLFAFLGSIGSIILNFFLLRLLNQAQIISEGEFLLLFITVIVLTICLFFPKIYKAFKKMIK
ncbi:MAG: serine/threonine protein kinase [Crocosphaera sp.]